MHLFLSFLLMPYLTNKIDWLVNTRGIDKHKMFWCPLLVICVAAVSASVLLPVDPNTGLLTSNVYLVREDAPERFVSLDLPGRIKVLTMDDTLFANEHIV